MSNRFPDGMMYRPGSENLYILRRSVLLAGLLLIIISVGGTARSQTKPQGLKGSEANKVIGRQEASVLFSGGHRILKYLAGKVSNHRLSWEELHRLVGEVGVLQEFRRSEQRSAIDWLKYLESNSRQLAGLFNLSLKKHTVKQSNVHVFMREGNSLLTPVQRSMWRHCKLNFENRHPELRLKLVSGFHSPAFQALALSRFDSDLKQALKRTAPPGFSMHQQAVPDVTVALQHKKGGKFLLRKYTGRLFKICEPFGFTPVSSDPVNKHVEMGFVGHARLYRSTLANKIIPRRLKYNFLNAMERTGFYPSPDGMRVLMALSAQESSMSWNPRLNRRKKEELRSRFHRILGTIENSLGGRLTELIFSDELNQVKKELIAELERITNPAERSIREYDVYVWTRKVSGFIQQLLQENRRLTQLGKWFYKLELLANQIRYEPQTFGLWQINANHLSERIERHQQLHRRFPEIFKQEGDRWLVVRSRMIDVLSGRRNSVLDRQRGLELIIHTYLQPRYESHLLGDREDLTYFIVENVAGEMSTFRAAVQQELNNRLCTSLELDGDLSFYLPYSTEINWDKTSNTQKAFKKFIELRFAYFKRPVDTDKLLKDLCQADDWVELQASELYRRIMRKKRGSRIFPNIRSSLYQQTPQIYADVVWRKSRLF